MFRTFRPYTFICKAGHTNNTPYVSNAVQLVVYVGRNGDGNNLYRLNEDHQKELYTGEMLTMTMTMVLCPREKKRPHVTGNCPSPIKPLVALSIALSSSKTEVVKLAKRKGLL